MREFLMTRLVATKGRARRAALVAVLLAGTALGGFAVGHAGWAAAPETTAPAPAITGMKTPLADFSGLVKQVRPAVVSITTKLKMSNAVDEGQPQLPFPFPFAAPQPQMRAVEARGSGFIVDPSGIIVTNNHVVKDAKSVSVTLSDGTELPAKILGRDPRTDLAVLKVDAGHPLTAVQLGNSEAVEPGQWVIAMGNPFGLGGTVTAGIVSARGRDIGAGPYDKFIQVDAPINQGNSGGPLFTQDGEVVGVNTAILSPSGGSVGIGFAIPSNTVKTIVAQLEKTGQVQRGYLGVEAQPVAESMAQALNLPGKGGALVASVQPGTPAAKAGIQAGDVIVSVNGKKISDPRELAVTVADIKPGDAAKVDVLRDGGQKTFDVMVASLPSEVTADASGSATAHQPHIGLALAPITPELRNRLNLPHDVQGAVVSQVETGSPADNAGIQPGDVIVGVGTSKVASPSEAANAIRHAVDGKGKAVALRIMRQGQTSFVAVNLGAKPANQG
jgi:serine protease Do